VTGDACLLSSAPVELCAWLLQRAQAIMQSACVASGRPADGGGLPRRPVRRRAFDTDRRTARRASHTTPSVDARSPWPSAARAAAPASRPLRAVRVLAHLNNAEPSTRPASPMRNAGFWHQLFQVVVSTASVVLDAMAPLASVAARSTWRVRACLPSRVAVG